jgi:hypothetical protein
LAQAGWEADPLRALKMPLGTPATSEFLTAGENKSLFPIFSRAREQIVSRRTGAGKILPPKTAQFLSRNVAKCRNWYSPT